MIQIGWLLSVSILQLIKAESSFMVDYYTWHSTPMTKWISTVSFPSTINAAYQINWVSQGMVTPATSQGRCATCHAFSCIADVEGAWASSGHPLIKLSEQEIIDCSSGDAYGMNWIQKKGGVASNADAPLANHSDPNLTGCRFVTNCSAVETEVSAYINGTTCLTNHNESNILALLQYGPLSVSISAAPFSRYHGGVINCSGDGIDHAVTLVAYGVDPTTSETYWTVKNSWGPEWGESSPPDQKGRGRKGYARLKYGNSCLRGPCQAYVGEAPAWHGTM